jgi:hypothetical protein
MLILLLIGLLVLAILFGVLSFVVHHLFLVAAVAAVVALVIVGHIQRVTPTSVQHDLRHDLHLAAQVPHAPEGGGATTASA